MLFRFEFAIRDTSPVLEFPHRDSTWLFLAIISTQTWESGRKSPSNICQSLSGYVFDVIVIDDFFRAWEIEREHNSSSLGTIIMFSG